jgi:hypothetical protein
MHGIALKCKGYDVYVLERTPTSVIASQGASLSGGSDDRTRPRPGFVDPSDQNRQPYAIITMQFQIINSKGYFTNHGTRTSINRLGCFLLPSPS